MTLKNAFLKKLKRLQIGVTKNIDPGWTCWNLIQACFELFFNWKLFYFVHLFLIIIFPEWWNRSEILVIPKLIIRAQNFMLFSWPQAQLSKTIHVRTFMFMLNLCRHIINIFRGLDLLGTCVILYNISVDRLLIRHVGGFWVESRPFSTFSTKVFKMTLVKLQI
jgi:hypothetical protein